MSETLNGRSRLLKLLLQSLRWSAAIVIAFFFWNNLSHELSKGTEETPHYFKIFFITFLSYLVLKAVCHMGSSMVAILRGDPIPPYLEDRQDSYSTAEKISYSLLVNPFRSGLSRIWSSRRMRTDSERQFQFDMNKGLDDTPLPSQTAKEKKNKYNAAKMASELQKNGMTWLWKQAPNSATKATLQKELKRLGGIKHLAKKGKDDLKCRRRSSVASGSDEPCAWYTTYTSCHEYCIDDICDINGNMFKERLEVSLIRRYRLKQLSQNQGDDASSPSSTDGVGCDGDKGKSNTFFWYEGMPGVFHIGRIEIVKEKDAHLQENLKERNAIVVG